MESLECYFLNEIQETEINYNMNNLDLIVLF